MSHLVESNPFEEVLEDVEEDNNVLWTARSERSLLLDFLEHSGVDLTSFRKFVEARAEEEVAFNSARYPDDDFGIDGDAEEVL